MPTHDTDVVITLEVPSPPAQEAMDAAEVSDLAQRVEALLITSSRPLSAARLAEALDLVETPALDAPSEPAIVTRVKRRARRAGASPTEQISAAVAALNAVYQASGRTFRIEGVAGGFRFMTLPQFGPLIVRLQAAAENARLSRAAIEALAIIAYKQPITRGKLEGVRGCGCGEVLKTLVERRLVTVAGRAEELGRPLLYATTRQFLEAFGLSSLKDLPTSADLK